MTILKAAQLIFSRVETEYSPHNRSGFQTVYKGRSLSDSLIKEVEQRIQCFSPVDGRRRLQFFTLNEVAVVSKTIVIPSHKTIVDRSGREGMFIVHCMIIAIQDFNRIGNNPFALLDTYDPYMDAETMVAALGQATGEIDDITIQSVAVQGTDLLSTNEMLKLFGAMSSSSQTNKGTVMFFGPADDGENILRTLHGLLTPHQRIHCTFDTCLDRCNLPTHISYGVTAYTQRPGGTYLATVDLDRRQVTVSTSGNKKDLYTVWLEAAANTRPFSAITIDAEDAYTLATAFETRQPLPRFDLKADLAREFFATFQQLITPKLNKSIASWLPDEVARAVTLFVIAAFRDDSGEVINRALSGAASEKAPADYLSDWVLFWLIQEKQELPVAAYKQMQDLARQGRFPPLLFYVATTSKKIDTKARDEALVAMDNEQFRQVLDYYLKPIEPVHYVHHKHLLSLFNAPNVLAMNGTQAADFIKRIVDLELTAYLEQVHTLVRLLDREELTSVEKAISKKKQIPPIFAEAVRRQRQKIGEDPSLLGRLKFW